MNEEDNYEYEARLFQVFMNDETTETRNETLNLTEFEADFEAMKLKVNISEYVDIDIYGIEIKGTLKSDGSTT